MKQHRGFTLIELMVTISLITMFSSIVLATIQPIRAQARDAKRKQEIRQLDLAIQQYIADKGYPPEWEGCRAQQVASKSKSDVISGCMAVSTQGLTAGTVWRTFVDELVNNGYMTLDTVPSDPCTGDDCGDFGYTYYPPAAVEFLTDGESDDYQISGNLEEGSSASGSTGVASDQPPVINLIASPVKLTVKQSSLVSWSVTNAYSCSFHLEGLTGDNSENLELEGPVESFDSSHYLELEVADQLITIILNCSGLGGSSSESTQIGDYSVMN